MAPPLVVVACMFSLMWAWLEKVGLMDVGIKLQKNHSIFSLYMWKNAIPSIVFFVKHRLLCKHCTILAKNDFLFCSRVFTWALTNAECILVKYLLRHLAGKTEEGKNLIRYRWATGTSPKRFGYLRTIFFISFHSITSSLYYHQIFSGSFEKLLHVSHFCYTVKKLAVKENAWRYV